MTTVTFSENNNLIRVTAHDHAYGSEIVCNGVSVLMYALEAWLLNHPDCVCNHESEFKSGRAEIEFVPTSDEVYQILGFVYEGLLQVEYSYGEKFIRVNASEGLRKLMG